MEFFFPFYILAKEDKKFLPVENIKKIYDDQITSINRILNPNALNWN